MQPAPTLASDLHLHYRTGLDRRRVTSNRTVHVLHSKCQDQCVVVTLTCFGGSADSEWRFVTAKESRAALEVWCIAIRQRLCLRKCCPVFVEKTGAKYCAFWTSQLQPIVSIDCINMLERVSFFDVFMLVTIPWLCFHNNQNANTSRHDRLVPVSGRVVQHPGTKWLHVKDFFW